MLKPNQTIVLCWTPNIKDYYTKLGYKFTKMREKFEVKVEDLKPTSAKKVLCICDSCGKEFQRQMLNRASAIDDEFGELCYQCAHNVRMKKRNKEKYGVEIPSQLPELREQNRIHAINQSDATKEKRKQTCLKRYGTAFYVQSDDCKEKSKHTLMQRYGVQNASQAQSVKEKKRLTTQRHYGVDNPLQHPMIKQKMQDTILNKYGVSNVSHVSEIDIKKRQTCLQNYGVEYPMQNSTILEKSKRSFYHKGNAPSSKVERKLCQQLERLYGTSQCYRGYPEYKYNLDCLVIVNNVKIDVEYDGWFYHKNHQERDAVRDSYMFNQGYKVLRIKGNYQIPSDESLKAQIHKLYSTQSVYEEIILDI